MDLTVTRFAINPGGRVEITYAIKWFTAAASRSGDSKSKISPPIKVADKTLRMIVLHHILSSRALRVFSLFETQYVPHVLGVGFVEQGRVVCL